MVRVESKLVRVPRIVWITVAAVAMVAASVGFYVDWWAPKAQFACNGTPWGPRSPEAAAELLVASVIKQDTSMACRAVTSGYDRSTLDATLNEWLIALGTPERTEEIAVVLGEQMGSSTPVTLEGPGGVVQLDVESLAGQYRISTLAP